MRKLRREDPDVMSEYLCFCFLEEVVWLDLVYIERKGKGKRD